MIKPVENKFARMIFNYYEERLLKKNFEAFFLHNSDFIINPNKALLLLPNHFSWWDGFLIDFLTRKLEIKKNFHIVMLEEQLKKYWFFRYLGAIGFNPNNPRGIVELINYLEELLNNPNNLVVFYMQGQIQFFNEKMELQNGLKLILNKISADFNIKYSFFSFDYFENKTPQINSMLFESLNKAEIVNYFENFKLHFISKFSEFNSLKFHNKSKTNIFDKL